MRPEHLCAGAGLGQADGFGGALDLAVQRLELGGVGCVVSQGLGRVRLVEQLGGEEQGAGREGQQPVVQVQPYETT